MIKPWRILGRRQVYAAPPFIEVSVETVALRSRETSLGHAAPLAFFLLEEAAPA